MDAYYGRVRRIPPKQLPIPLACQDLAVSAEATAQLVDLDKGQATALIFHK